MMHFKHLVKDPDGADQKFAHLTEPELLWKNTQLYKCQGNCLDQMG